MKGVVMVSENKVQYVTGEPDFLVKDSVLSRVLEDAKFRAGLLRNVNMKELIIGRLGVEHEGYNVSFFDGSDIDIDCYDVGGKLDEFCFA